MNELRKKQMDEAVKRMTMLGMHDHLIELLQSKKHTVCVNYCNFLHDEAGEKMRPIIRSYEEKSGNLVYYVIQNDTSLGEMFAMLYVSRCEEDWKMERSYINNGAVNVYVHNADNPQCSEQGLIGVKAIAGGVMRIW